MENQRIIKQITDGMEYYMNVLAMPSHMEKYDDGMCEWIKPKDGMVGPAGVYRVFFGDKTDDQISRIIRSYRDKGAPGYWVVTPFSTPRHIRNLLISLNVLKPHSEDTAGMALSMDGYNTVQTNAAANIPVRKADNREDFEIWTGIVNKVFFGCCLLDPELYFPVCESGMMKCFLGYFGDTPVSASATLNHHGNGTLEFIATLPEFRKRGIGAAVCRAAIEQLIGEEASIITLRASAAGISLYTSLGFKTYFRL